MSEFKRGIKNQEFINALNTFYNDEESFWFKMVNDKELFIAIGDKEVVRVYYKGQRICILSYRKTKEKNIILGKTDNKYFGVEENCIVVSENGVILNNKSKIKSLSEVELIKENVQKHIGKEKDKSYSEILNNEKFIIDVEVTFVRNKVTNPKTHADYEISLIDYVALDQENKLVFYEAKHFKNSDIRSTTSPRVIEQIRRYEVALHHHENEILDSYNLILQNLNELHVLTHRNISTNKLMNKKISIDFEPRLIIFGVERDEKIDIHLKKLREYFGKKRLILK